MSDPDTDFVPDPAYPANPEFYRRVLHELPSPVLVVDESGQIVYGNRAIERLGGWDIRSAVGRSVLDYVHPDDVDALAESFLAVAESDESDTFGVVPWASINTRLVTANAQVIPVTVTGAGGLEDPVVRGIVYDIRPAHEQDILRRGLSGLARGEPIDEILHLITAMVTLPPLGLDSAVLEPRGDGTYRVIGATSDTFHSILSEAVDPQPWNLAGGEPVCTIVSRFPGEVGEDLFAAGYREFWHVSPEPGRDEEAYRLVAAGPSIQRPAAGQIERLSRANELAGVVLLRARADALLEHSATHDRLTDLPNRDGFHRRGADILAQAESETAAMLFIDLDDFKEVNDAFGHAAGDRVLVAVARRLMSLTRSIDLVGRLGGDEFVILVGDSSDRPANRDRVQVIADRALEELRRPIDIGESNVSVAASIGAAIVPMPTTLETLLAEADSAMYVAKHAGGDAHHIVHG